MPAWAEPRPQAACRFLSNPCTDRQTAAAPLGQQSAAHARPQGWCLNIQDTTELDFNGHQTLRLGLLNHEVQHGMYLQHPGLCAQPCARAAGWAGCLDVGTPAQDVVDREAG